MLSAHKMNKGISEIVGHAALDEGGSIDVYRALRSLICAECGAEIAEGALFTRHQVKGIGLRIMPQCPECAPFSLQADNKEKSALLQSLLAKQPAHSAGRAGVSDEVDAEALAKAKYVDEEVRRRLAPALRRGRHRK